MSSPGQRHKQRLIARQGAEQAASSGMATGAVADSLHLQLIALDQDMVRLRKLARIGDRVNMKRDELMPKYRPYVERYLAAVAESGQPYQNELFQRLIIWAFDVGDFDAGIAWAELAIAAHPEQHQAGLGPLCGRHRAGVGRETGGRRPLRRALVLPGV